MSYYGNAARRGPAAQLARLLIVVLAWLGAAAGTLLVAAETSVGPVVLSLSHTHGVHIGDLLAMGFFSVVAGVITVALLAD